VNLANAANGFTAQVQGGALQVCDGPDTWIAAPTGLGFGQTLVQLGDASISTNSNRVDCEYGAVDEWFVNGPGGLEQGFTVARESQPGDDSALTVELAISGNLRTTVTPAGDGLSLAPAGGTTVLQYAGLSACDATGKELPASMEIHDDGNRQFLQIHVNAAGAQGAITIDPSLQEAILTAQAPVNDNFGVSVCVDQSTVVVGAYGAAYVFTQPAGGWNSLVQPMDPTAKLTAPDAASGGEFGDAVGISGNIVVVGPPLATNDRLFISASPFLPPPEAPPVSM
jgi:hypothetical protein